MTGTLYTPLDVVEAYGIWKASCGPAALAALLGKPVMEVRPFFPGFRGWCNPTDMKAAVGRAGVRWKDTVAEYRTRFPLRGLAFVQIEGPWTRPGVPPKAAYRHTHWAGMVGGMVYDINAEVVPGLLGGWLPEREWDGLMDGITAEHKGSTGWHVRSGIEFLS